MEKMPKWQAVLRIAGFIGCVFLLTCMVTMILKPKRLDAPYDNTGKVRGFYMEEANSLDLVFIGSSQVFSTIMPSVLEEETGLSSYVFAGNEQPFSISYYYIMEALKYQNPKAIVLETTFCNWGDMPRDAVVRINFDDMRWGKAKCLGILNNTEPQNWEYFFFELSKYHSRWDALNARDLAIKDAYFTKNETKGWSFYEKSDDPAKQYGKTVKEEVLNCTQRKELDENALKWLSKIAALCKEEEVQLILLKTPNDGEIICPSGGESDEEAIEYIDGMAYYNSLGDYAKEEGIPFLNMNMVMPGTNHNDAENARKATSYFGKWVQDYLE
ncbi:MAG: hypothetical protein IKY23_06975 [Lachnospiraceae bacterium]|nr:hypothetical protein [Lachnospiraceae bacterium]